MVTRWCCRIITSPLVPSSGLLSRYSVPTVGGYQLPTTAWLHYPGQCIVQTVGYRLFSLFHTILMLFLCFLLFVCCISLGPFHGARAVPSVTRCRCRCCRGHRCAGGARQYRCHIWWMGVRRLAVANGPNIFQMLLVFDSSLCYKWADIQYTLVIDPVAGEIIRLVASVCVCVRPFVCGRSPVWTVWPLTLIFGMTVDLHWDLRTT